MSLQEFAKHYSHIDVTGDPRAIEGDLDEVIAEQGAVVEALVSAVLENPEVRVLQERGIRLVNHGLLYGHVLGGILTDSPPIDSHEHSRWIDDFYAPHTNEFFEALETAVAYVTDRLGTPEADDEWRRGTLPVLGHFIGLSTFHATQRFWLTPWLSLIAQERGPRSPAARQVFADSTTTAQVLIAAHAVHYLKLRTALLPWVARGDEEAIALRSTVNGHLAEIDGAIALLPLHDGVDDVIVLPGPPQFEMVAGRFNADFVVLDFTYDFGLGVQIKSVRSALADDAYAKPWIEIVAADEDLGSVGFERDSAGGPEREVPRPGLLAMKFLSIQNAERVLVRGEERRSLVAWGRAQAEELVAREASKARTAMQAMAAGTSRHQSAAAYQKAVRRGKEQTRAEYEDVVARLGARLRPYATDPDSSD